MTTTSKNTPLPVATEAADVVSAGETSPAAAPSSRSLVTGKVYLVAEHSEYMYNVETKGYYYFGGDQEANLAAKAKAQAKEKEVFAAHEARMRTVDGCERHSECFIKLVHTRRTFVKDGDDYIPVEQVSFISALTGEVVTDYKRVVGRLGKTVHEGVPTRIAEYETTGYWG